MGPFCTVLPCTAAIFLSPPSLPLPPFPCSASCLHILHILHSRYSHFIAFFNLPAFLLQALFLNLSCSPLGKLHLVFCISLSYPLLRTSLRSSAIFTASSDSHFVTFFLFTFGTILSAVSFTMSRISFHSSSGSLPAS